MKRAFDSTVRASLVVAIGGALLGFDSVVVSGVNGPVRAEFDLTAGQLGFTASCLVYGAMIGNAVAGALASRFGRRSVLQIAALLFFVSALGSAFAFDLTSYVAARMTGGVAVGLAILIAPIYIAEISPPERRGRLVSFNQLNIVLGISAAGFSNYAVAQLVEGPNAWRWMLGVEALPAALYFVLLFTVPRSPRWLVAQGRRDEAEASLAQFGSSLAELPEQDPPAPGALKRLFSRPLARVMTIALGLAFFQQITGINAIFFYSATIFEKAGAGVSSSLGQAIVIGLVNLVFTLVALRTIDQFGRKPLLLLGSAGMAIALFVTSSAFDDAEYRLTPDALASVVEADTAEYAALAPLGETAFGTRTELLDAARPKLEAAEIDLVAFENWEDRIERAALEIDGRKVLLAIMLFIASFAFSLGPVMWAMLSEIFPGSLRESGISVAGFFNSLVSASVVWAFPIGLDRAGPAAVFLFFGVLAALTFLFTLFVVPETKGRSLEELEKDLVRA